MLEICIDIRVDSFYISTYDNQFPTNEYLTDYIFWPAI